VDARLSNGSVALNETVTLILETEGQTPISPDLSVLEKDFRILGRRSQRNVSIVDNRRSERHQLMLTLSPRRAGELRIPPIVAGDAATRPLVVQVEDEPAPPPQNGILLPTEPRPLELQSPGAVNAPESSSKVLLETSIEPARVRVRQQAVLTAKVYMPSLIMGPQLHDPTISGARVLPLGEDGYQVRRNDRQYSVYERRYAIFPRDAGHLEIEPLVFEGWIRTGSVTSAYFPHGSPVEATSDPLTLQVLPAPRSAAKDTWLPARSLSLSEGGPESYRVAVGRPVERMISIRADGLMASDLPALKPFAPQQLSERRGRAQLWNERLPTGVVGTRREPIQLTASKPGRYRLPALSIDWWDTDTGRSATASLPARELIVTPTEPVTDGLSRGDRSSVTARQEWNPQPAGARGPERSTPKPGSAPETSPEPGLWLWITALVAMAWLGTTAAWWRSRRRPPSAPPATRPPEPRKEAAPESAPQPEPVDPLDASITAVRAAYDRGDATAAREALLDWGRQVLPKRPPTNLTRLAERCRDPLRGEILTLEQAFFSPRPLHWERQPVSEHLRHFEPVPVQPPASFRRPKPIRRRSAKPESPS
jgi:hypothetical protein